MEAGSNPRRKLRLVSIDETADRDLKPLVDRVDRRLVDGAENEWADVITDFLLHVELNRSPGTLRFYRDRLRQFGKWIEKERIALANFRARDLRRYHAYRRSLPVENRLKPATVSDTTQRHDIVSVRLLLKFARSEGLIDINPLADYECPAAPKGRGKFATELDVTLLLVSMYRRWDPAQNLAIKNVHPARRRFFSKRNFAIMAGLMDSGCRIGEFLALTTADINRDPVRPRITLRAANTKDGEDRVVPISNDWLLILDAWLAVRPPQASSVHLFVNEYGDPMSVNSWDKSFREHVRWARAQRAYANMNYITTHSLRHYAGTSLGKQGLLAAQKQLGHASATTTQIYIHVDQDMPFMSAAHTAAQPLTKVLNNLQEAGVGSQTKPVLVNKRSENNKKRKRLV